MMPRDEKGRFFPVDCPDPNCGGGKLVNSGGGDWECDGLRDPGDPNKELECCTYYHRDGEARIQP